jgi:hypothetical protein
MLITIVQVFVVISFTFIFIIAMKNQWQFTAICFGFALLMVGCDTMVKSGKLYNEEVIQNGQK